MGTPYIVCDNKDVNKMLHFIWLCQGGLSMVGVFSMDTMLAYQINQHLYQNSNDESDIKIKSVKSSKEMSFANVLDGEIKAITA